MFRSNVPDLESRPKTPRPQTPRRSPRFNPKSNEFPTSSNAERPFTAFATSFAGDDLKNRLPSKTIKGMKVLWRQSQMAQSLRRPNRDGQMPVEELSDTSDSSGNSSLNLVVNNHRVSKTKRRQLKDGSVVVIKKVAEAPQEEKVVEKKKEVAEVAVQAMRPACIDPLVEGRLNMLESRLRLEEMRSKSWCVRMTEAEESVKQLQAKVQALCAGVNGTGTQSRFPSVPSKERGLWPTNFAEGRKPPKVASKTSQFFGKDFTAEFHAILQQIRKDNESEEIVGDSCADTKN